jgi:hypothetical protein
MSLCRDQQRIEQLLDGHLFDINSTEKWLVALCRIIADVCFVRIKTTRQAVRFRIADPPDELFGVVAAANELPSQLIQQLRMADGNVRPHVDSP